MVSEDGPHFSNEEKKREALLLRPRDLISVILRGKEEAPSIVVINEALSLVYAYLINK